MRSPSKIVKGRRTGRWSRVLVAAALTATVAACGGGSEEPSGTASSSAAPGAFPVTIEHKYGSTTVTKASSRVVTLGLSDQDTVLALGIKPVGAVDWFGERPFGNWAWTKDLWGTTPPEIVGERDDYNVEKIVALKPDLIIAQYSGMTQEQYTTLSKIAPVVAQAKQYDDYATPWDEMAKVIGRALGAEPKVDQLLAAIDKRLTEIRQQHPEFATQTAVVADPSEPGTYAAFAKGDPKAQLLGEMGYKLSDQVEQLAGKEIAAVVSSERLDLLDVDRLVLLTADPAVEPRVKADPVYAALKVAKEGRAVFVPYMEPPVGAALSFVTVLSVPYAIDQLLPMLVAPGR
ncbi:iron complex transport system substrate-binding protein [Micromonospora pisi]|uniref:Iron complex transport system substrate-binding protein n=1 Tax=Micromonospora pisi TaxID=589240 RepID=A0A495JCW8_9ACTN|nr:iron-siderophore ABC transporter substrate-binding protein [Micromonospora pisi]RKR85909.1 iron complex transport system substrate-binding protein [Micromonospora pisi]